MDIINIIKAYQSVQNGKDCLDKEEEKFFFSFLKYLKATRKARFICRGIGNETLDIEYGTTTDNLDLLSDFIFCIGEKGRCFFDNKRKGIDSNSSDIVREEFERIWGKMHEKICNLGFIHQNSRERVKSFLLKNPKIKDYFSNTANKEHFIRFVNSPNAILIKDYYSALLHSIGKSCMPNSYFLSTSLSDNVAHNFRGGCGIIIYGWVPRKGLKDRIIQYSDITKKNLEIKKLGLPAYIGAVYPEQEEICLKCGLLPHYIIGFSCDKKFYINPNILSLSKDWNDNIVYDGININQTKFNKLFSMSNYGINFFYIDGTYYILKSNDIKGIREV